MRNASDVGLDDILYPGAAPESVDRHASAPAQEVPFCCCHPSPRPLPLSPDFAHQAQQQGRCQGLSKVLRTHQTTKRTGGAHLGQHPCTISLGGGAIGVLLSLSQRSQLKTMRLSKTKYWFTAAYPPPSRWLSFTTAPTTPNSPHKPRWTPCYTPPGGGSNQTDTPLPRSSKRW